MKTPVTIELLASARRDRQSLVARAVRELHDRLMDAIHMTGSGVYGWVEEL